MANIPSARPVDRQFEMLRHRAAQFRSLAKSAPLDQQVIADGLLAAARDLDAKALELEGRATREGRLHNCPTAPVA
jgi:hypothetical protein